MVNVLRYLSVVRSAVPRVLPLMRDHRVPQWLKVSAVAAACIIISPLDIFGDIPILGILDDATLLALLATLFVNTAEKMLPRNEEQTMRTVHPIELPPNLRS
jgi:uncharacterized membrane protein YkvA (DUF1232 family)